MYRLDDLIFLLPSSCFIYDLHWTSHLIFDITHALMVLDSLTIESNGWIDAALFSRSIETSSNVVRYSLLHGHQIQMAASSVVVQFFETVYLEYNLFIAIELCVPNAKSMFFFSQNIDILKSTQRINRTITTINISNAQKHSPITYAAIHAAAYGSINV